MKTRKDRSGFSLIELLVSASVAGVSALVLGQGMVNWQGSQSKVTSLNQLGALESNLRLFFSQGNRCREFLSNNSGVLAGIGGGVTGTIPMNTANLGAFGVLSKGAKMPGGTATLSDINFSYQVLMSLPGSTQIFAGRLNLIYTEEKSRSRRDFSVPLQFFKVGGTWSCNAPSDTSATNLEVLCQFWGGGTWNSTTQKCERSYCAELGLGTNAGKCETRLSACGADTFWSSVEPASATQQWQNTCIKLSSVQSSARQCTATAGGLVGIQVGATTSKPECAIEPSPCAWTQWSSCTPTSCWDGTGPLPSAFRTRECVYKYNGVSACDPSSCGGGVAKESCTLASSLIPVCPSSGACGTAHGTSRKTPPSTAEELCKAGTASPVTAMTTANTGPHSWRDKHGVWRYSGGISFKTGPWTWTCSGAGGGTSASCQAVLAPPTCYMSIYALAANRRMGNCTLASGFYPTQALCESAWKTEHSGPGPNCIGESQCRALVGGDPYEPYCSSITTKPVNGVCGEANGTTRSMAPSLNKELCAVGTPSQVVGTGPWTWSCSGSAGGASASCTAETDCGGGGSFKSYSGKPGTYQVTACTGSCMYPPGTVITPIQTNNICKKTISTCAPLVVANTPTTVTFQCTRK